MAPASDQDLAQRFDELARRWRRQTEYASLTEMEAHPDRAALKALGRPLVPLVLAELALRPDVRWLGLLSELTGVDPAQGAQSVAEAAARWRRWAEQQG